VDIVFSRFAGAVWRKTPSVVNHATGAPACVWAGRRKDRNWGLFRKVRRTRGLGCLGQPLRAISRKCLPFPPNDV